MKRNAGLWHLPNHECLQSLGALSLNNLRLYSNIWSIYISLGIVAHAANDYSFSLVSSNTTANGVKLVQHRAKTRRTPPLFSCRTQSAWKNLSFKIL